MTHTETVRIRKRGDGVRERKKWKRKERIKKRRANKRTSKLNIIDRNIYR